MKQPEYHFSFYSNSTRVNILKVSFPRYILTYVDKAIQDVSRYGTGKIPFIIYPIFASALMKYDKKWKSDKILIWKDHVCVGVIKEDIPKAEIVCKECGSKMELVPEPLVKLNWVKRLIKKVLKEAFEQTSTYKLVCVECKSAEFITKVI